MSRFLATLALFAVSLLVSAGAAEVILRWRVGPPVHFKYPQPRYVPDEDIGHWLQPGQRGFNHDTPLQVNSVGIRGPERTKAVPPGTLRILALGDSQTFGNGLPLEETWPARLAMELENRSPPSQWQVLNAGLSGTDTWQHERMLETLAQSYDFDAVVLGFYVNDVTTAYEPRPAQERTNTWSKRIAYQLKRSALVTAFWQAARGAFLSADASERERRVLSGESRPHVDRAWDQVEQSLVRIQRSAGERKAPFVLLVLPRRDQVISERPPTGYNQRIAQIAGRHHIPVVDVLGPLRSAYEQHDGALFIPWDGHNSALANEVIADELASHLLAQQREWAGASRAEPSVPGNPVESSLR